MKGLTYLATALAPAALHIHLLVAVKTSHGMHSVNSNAAYHIDGVGDEERGTKYMEKRARSAKNRNFDMISH